MQINRKIIEEPLRSETSLPQPEVERLAKLIANRLKQEERKRMKALGRAGGAATKARHDPEYYSKIGKMGGRGHKKPREEDSNG